MLCERDHVPDGLGAVERLVDVDAVELREVSPEGPGVLLVVVVAVDQLAEPLDFPEALA